MKDGDALEAGEVNHRRIARLCDQSLSGNRASLALLAPNRCVFRAACRVGCRTFSRYGVVQIEMAVDASNSPSVTFKMRHLDERPRIAE